MLEISTLALSATFVRDLYTRMLLTRFVDECAGRLHSEGEPNAVISCRGHEAAQVASALCIEVGIDFTLPYYRDLGVVLTIGMTPYEVLRTYVQTQEQFLAKKNTHPSVEKGKDVPTRSTLPTMMHWGYAKHNTVTGSAPVATQILHAAGIAFSCKLRKATAVTVAYCGDGASAEPDFLEGILFATQYHLPVVIIYEQNEAASSLQELPLPADLEYSCVDGMDAIAVYTTMLAAMKHVRTGGGPILLEMKLARPATPNKAMGAWQDDPLQCCQRYLEEQGQWDEDWSTQLRMRLEGEVEQAWQDAIRSNV